jgi:predicted SprT family Zn-dependent metalloprotease
LYRRLEAILEDQTISDEIQELVFAHPVMINEAIKNLGHSYFLTRTFDLDPKVKEKLESMYQTGS